MEISALQQSLFAAIKSNLRPGQSMPKLVADTLHVGLDAAYKKMSGRRCIDTVELELLLTRFNISLHDLQSPVKSTKVWFEFNPIGPQFTFKQYLQQLITELTALNRLGVKHIIYSAKEVPMFYNFMFPELGCFKAFVWQKSILQLPAFTADTFSVAALDAEVVELGRTIYDLFLSIPSKEIWNYETVNCTTRQIEFYRTSKLFADAQSEQVVFEQYKKLIGHIEQQTASGYKIDQHGMRKGTFELYHNELILGDNSVLAQFEDGRSMAFITPNAVNTLNSSDERITRYLEENLNHILKKSVNLSNQSEKLRTPFFDSIYRALVL